MKDTLAIPDHLDGKIWFYQNRGACHVPHTHDELEINLITAGRGTYLVKGEKLELRRNVQLWLFPGQEHGLLGRSPDFEMWIVVVKAALLRRVCNQQHTRILQEADPTGRFIARLSEGNASRLRDLFREIDIVSNDASIFNAGVAYCLLAAWQAQQSAVQITGMDVHPAVERAALLLRQMPTAFDLTDMARRVNLSPARLSHLFKKQTGIGLVKFRQRCQIERFLRLYGVGGKHTLTTASLAAGFGSYPQFHRVFRAFMGCSPAQYRRSMIQN